MNRNIFLAEVIGTFLLVYVGAGSVAVSNGNLIAAAFAHGFILIALIIKFGDISGTHINPAISISIFAARKMNFKELLIYLSAQIIGGIIAGILLYLTIPQNTTFNTHGLYGATVLGDGVSGTQGLVIELVLTMILAASVHQIAVKNKGGDKIPFYIGFTLIAIIFMGGPLTGASLNPSRTLGPLIARMMDGSLLSSEWMQLFSIFTLGPVIGATLAAIFYKNFFNT